MSTDTQGEDLLCELARSMDSRQDYIMAIALRKLARAGYSTLDEVDAASDLVLLATPQIGVRRLKMVRRLVRPEWQPPSPQVTMAAEKFLAAARVALTFWSLDTLESVLRGSLPLPACERPAEKRLAIELFSLACSKALRHCAVDELGEALRQVSRFADGESQLDAPAPSDVEVQTAPRPEQRAEAPKPARSKPRRRRQPPTPDSDRYAFSRERRMEIVEHFRAARARGEVSNKDYWARSHFNISAKTLVRYEREFPEADAKA
jgi:hypothetical protein